jgi:SAM-dependent methyltransferase
MSKTQRKAVETVIFRDEESSWDTIWKWDWFSRVTWKPSFREEIKNLCHALNSLLPILNTKNILDCSCGLGLKTIMLSEMGYEVEGSDRSPFAIEHASQLAREEGLDIRFFLSQYKDLAKTSQHKFDCVYSDAFDWIRTRRDLKAAAKGISSVLDNGGKFIFHGALSNWGKPDLKRIIEDFRKHKEFEIFTPYEKDGIRLSEVTICEKTSLGVLEKRVYISEEKKTMRAEVAFMLNLIKWTWQDYTEVLGEVGFREFEYIEKDGMVLNMCSK